MKAVIFINLQCLAQFAFISMSKYIYKEKGVNPFDTVIFANIVSLLVSSTHSLCAGKNFIVHPELRKPLIIRSVIGLAGLVSTSIGAILVPITVQLTLGNLAPFLASLIAFFANGEKMSCFEMIAMLLSFAGVAIVAFAQG